MILSKETALFQKDAIAKLASSSKYITKINDSGIKIHPYDDTVGEADANHFLSLTAEGMQIYNGGTSDSNVIAKFNTTNNNPTVTIGFTNTGKYNTHITQDGLYLRTGTDSYATLNADGLVLSKGGIKAGDYINDPTKFIYLSTEDYTDSPTITIGDNNANWRQVIGNKFGVKNDGTLYASNAYVEGAITATSLTIGGNENSYDGMAAINISGYDIVIYEDNTDESIVDHDNTTYLYPVMYHNGEIDETVDNTHYIWYVDDGNIGTIGDAAKGGIIASYGHNYRVTYDFDDGVVGSGTVIQDRLVDPSKYITKISDTGITIHPEDTSENNYLQIDGNGITIYKNTDSVAQFGTTARIGRINNSRFLINSNSLQGYDSSNVKYFEVSANGLSWGTNGANIAATTSQVASAAQTATNYIKIDGSGIKVQNFTDATDYLFIDSNKIALYRNNVEKIQLTDSLLRLGDISNYINLDINGMDIYRNGESLAQFTINGSRIGAYNAGRIVTSPNELAGYMTNGVRYFTMLENGGEVETYTYMAIWESDIDNSVTIDLSTDQRTRYYWSTVNASEGAIPITFVYHFTNGDPTNGRTRIFNLSITKGTATSNSHFTYDGVNTLTILSYKPTVTNPGQWTWTLYGKEISANHITNTTGPFFQFGTDEEELTHTAAYSMSIGKSVSTGPYGLAVGKYNEYHEHDAFSIGGGSNSTYGRYTVFAVDSGGGISAPAYVGLITLVASSTEIPNGWLRCDGDTWEITRYPELYDMIGTDFGTASSGYFKVPTLTAPSGMTYLIYTGRSQTHIIDGIIQS